jgi:hypothetical protein
MVRGHLNVGEINQIVFAELVTHVGREALLVFEKDVGPALVSACDYTDAMYLAKASEIVRREIFLCFWSLFVIVEVQKLCYRKI